MAVMGSAIIPMLMFAMAMAEMSIHEHLDIAHDYNWHVFSMKAQNAALIGHVIAVHRVTSEMDCAHWCLRSSQCASFSYDTDNATHVCEINDDIKEGSPDKFVAREGFSYFEPLILQGSLATCQHGTTCTMECDGQHNCSCPVGCSCPTEYSGAHREEIIPFNVSGLTCDDKPCKNNGSCLNIPDGYNCSCQTGFTGIHCEYAESCEFLKRSGKTSSRVYNISLSNLGLVPVFCDQVTHGGGWTLIQRRSAPFQMQFNRDWVDYQDGFGNLTGEFWLGNAIIHELSNSPRQMLIELTSSDGESGYAVYSHFSAKGPDESYRLDVYGYNGNISDCGGPSNWQMFTTRDADNDENKNQNCAHQEQAGWWYKDCGCGNLNRQAKPKWESWIQKDHIAESKMMIR